MLVLARKKGESVIIDNNIIVTVLSVEGDNVKIGISAPKEIDIYRKEVFDAIGQNNQNAVMDLATVQVALEQINKNAQK
ncbi:carbon storage regulator CsrA [Paenibacillus sp. 7523-1]|uniref:carbon storage regulator CsrA n=1 Tax=Paenibacillus sp. 7523-1 TaxID=2022550 RepID=UPI000BA5EE6F|nr:carbon storage regulator CsrA [Paenibacillus sp. 7523-1]PAD30668.1 carbon storage regulator [Paenibacillus sp. 7523-1]